MSQVNSIRNPDGTWINTQYFREEALNFEKYGYYCPDPWGSPAWKDYWEEQLERCKNGYEVAGVRITGHQYYYQNFCRIQVVKQLGDKAAEKIETFPDFWDGDYNYFWSLHIARYGLSPEEVEGLNLSLVPDPGYLDGGYHMIVGKSRRKGYSYKNGALCANIYNTKRNSLTIIGAFDKKYLYPKGTMGMTSNYLNFLNEHTGWRKSRDYVDKQDHKKASFKVTEGGVAIEKGYKSEVMAITFKDNPDAARGKDAELALLEEAGAFPNLLDSFMAIDPALRAGRFMTGQIVIFGTGGDMEGGTQDFAEMYYAPKAFELMPFVNIWDDNAENTSCGFFHSMQWNFEGFYDKEGNSDEEGALEYEMGVREKIKKNSSGSSVLNKRTQEYSTKPSEAFLTVSTNDFPVVELRARLNKVKREQLHIKKGQPVRLKYELVNVEVEPGVTKKIKKVRAIPDLKNELNPIWDYHPKIDDLSGCVVIFEHPQENIPKGLYKIGYDPYRQDQSTGVSLGAVYVYKGVQKGSYKRNEVVAMYVGRPSTTDDFNRTTMMITELYNAEMMHENEVTEVVSYFRKKNKLHLLAAQPDKVISKNIKESKVSRVFGCHMNEKLKDAGAKYIKRWLLEERDTDEHGDVIYNLDTLDDPGLIEEFIAYNKKGNFDRVMAFMQVMFQLEEDEEEKEYSNNPITPIGQELMTMKNKLFNRNNKSLF